MISKYLKTLSSSITKKVLITQSCPTLCDLRTIYSSPGSSIHGILLARILEWVAFPSSQASLVASSAGKEAACGRPGFGSLGWEDPLEKGMATHSSILAWRITWTV